MYTLDSGEDPSMFAVELETLAMRAFGDLSSSARLHLVRDRFIAGQMECSLRRHLDSVEPGTPIWDMVDRCCVWESHTEDTDCWGARPIPNRPLPVYRIDDVGTESGPVSYSEYQDMLGSLMQHLLPTPAVSPPRATPILLEHEQLIQRLMGKEHPVRPLLSERSSLWFGCPKITFDCISGHLWSIGHFGCAKFTFDGISGHFRSIWISIFSKKFFGQNGRRRPFWMSENNFWSISGHFRSIRNFLFDKMVAGGHFGWDDNVNYRTRPRYLDE